MGSGWRIGRHEDIYRDSRWETARQECIRNANGLCEECKRKGKIKAGKEVDHIEELTNTNKDNPDIAFNPKNLQYLCTDCHNEKHGRSIGLQKFLTPPG